MEGRTKVEPIYREVTEAPRKTDLVLVKMRSFVLLLALLQSLGASGGRRYSSEQSNRGLAAAVAGLNSVYDASHLYRATRSSVKRVVSVGLNTVDLLMVFGVKETQCEKASGSDPQTCAFRRGFLVPSFTCSSRVRVFPTSAQVASLKCGKDSSSSSSSESSEEMFSRGRHQFNSPFENIVPAPSAPPPPPPDETADEYPGRGDTFSNFL
ncbi:secreted phosphoprotein 24 isoform X1 [Hippoglossus hippoglossus]|uniref:secreted phosphoprotein 24 isoform X1 n=1 Tax=Hippoglossus hippoglossus TaxID=8267 RepID=UPI00148E7B61|nr:secreted phosphoprotein 24 isoform X1 [Hippoglossus hippoglossus]